MGETSLASKVFPTELALSGRCLWVFCSSCGFVKLGSREWGNVSQKVALVNGWYTFYFLSEEDRVVAEEHFWVIGRGFIVLTH